jgi:hypothetical protein
MGVVEALQEDVELLSFAQAERGEELVAAGGGADGQRLHECLSGRAQAEMASSGVAGVDGSEHEFSISQGVEHGDEVAGVDARQPR